MPSLRAASQKQHAQARLVGQEPVREWVGNENQKKRTARAHSGN